ncbi:SMC family ATPase [Treponema sp.]|uniref:AAA family ATPase n=1 Tax=Treponema sp. TaxID=166 RepID=UPI0025DC27A5|nr:SMC family ATPase [Treponema sp.]MCR5218538.1 SMC family ATPase [Treponema sp.]
MKPISLKMTGFESYCKPVEIDFTKVSDKGLFLICGSTGSGKTTIFDAITYALYGEPSGDTRKESMLRSTLADENIPTKVEFTFEVNSKIYTVKRNPKYIRKAKTGNKTVTENANAELIYSDGRDPVVQTSKVTAAVQDILKLCKKDFCQIAMIAQGAFQKFLLAPTEDKKTIFREIFKTSRYQQLEERLDADAKALSFECREINNQISHDINLIEAFDDEEKNKELSLIKEKSFPEENDIEFLEYICKDNDKKLKKNEKLIKDNQKELEEINSKATRAEEKRKIAGQIVSLTAQLENLKEESLAAESSLKKAMLREEEKSQAQEKLTLIKNSLEDYQQLDTEEKAAKDFAKKIAESLNSQNKLKNEIAVSEKEITAKKDRLNKLEDCGEQLIIIQNQLEEASDSYEQIQTIKNKYSGFIRQKEILNEKQEEAAKASQDFKNKNALYLEKKRLFFMEQAGILSQELIENQPCPVCGSLDHPSPAKKSGNAPDKEELDELEKEAEESSNNFTKLSGESSELMAGLSNEEKNLREQILSLLPDYTGTIENLNDSLLKKEGEVNKKLSLLRSQVNEAKDMVKEKTDLQNEIPLLEKTLSDDQASLSQNLIDCEKYRSALEEKTAFINKLKEKLLFSSKAQAEENISSLEDVINNIDRDIDNAKKTYENSSKKHAEYSGQLKQAQEVLATYQDINQEEVLSQQAKLEEKKYNLSQIHDSLISVCKNNSRSLESIKKLFESIATIEKKRQMVSHLANIANGNISSSGKVRLETYVQAAFFDRIIARANKRFLTMSSRQFELVRDISTENHRSQIGLDLNVVDHHNGSIRAVSTLSGGEQFQASLSLALGLSDEIQESSGGGGIHLDSMFIDEGFGSLDPATLNKAMNSLMSLAQNDKLIGIISHVEELKSRIDNRIIVTKDINGNSTVQIEN